jgi:diguanylate cyclase (GGDEF)-like protein
MPFEGLKRAAIGILPGWPGNDVTTLDRYLLEILGGIQARAAEQGCNLLLAWSTGRMVENGEENLPWPEAGPGTTFTPVGPWNTDGLIVFSPLLNPERSAYIQQLRENHHPVLFIASGEAGPSICVDNMGGIRQGIAHLVEHGHRRIAFVAGEPDDPGDSRARYAAYREAVAEFGLEDDDRLVAFGHHTLPGGYQATLSILRSGVEFSALQASDDISAIGCMDALQDAGRRIPDDVAVIGFDDQPDAAIQVPPLTSIHVPLAEIGAAALDRMLALIAGTGGLEPVIVPTRLALRQSCGCLPHTMVLAATLNEKKDPAVSKRAWADFKLAWEMQILAAFPQSTLEKAGTRLREQIDRLLESFSESIRQENSQPFDQALLTFLQLIERANLNTNPLQDATSALRVDLYDQPQHWPPLVRHQFSEDLFHRARTAISDSIQRSAHRHKFFSDQEAFRHSMLTARLSASLDRHQLVQILDQDLPGIGIRHARVFLYLPKNGDPNAASLLIDPEPENSPLKQPFPTRRFPPPGLYKEGELLNLALMPLVFQDELLGYAAFDAGDISGLAAIAQQLAANLKAERLHAEVVALSIIDDSTGIYNRRFLEIYLKKEVVRYKLGLSVIMLDIDNFKEYNDDFGHPAGDEVLVEVARCLQMRLRKMDVVARYGGDEFMVILPETSQDGALKVTENIRNAMAAISHIKRPLTLSMGVVTLRGSEFGAEDLVRHADEALYEAKRAGKNQVRIYQA